MNARDLFEMSYTTRQAAFDVLHGLRIEETVRKMDGTMHIVGSLKTDLMMWNRDIDIHVYSGDDMLSWSFGLMAAITRNGAIKEFRFLNLLDTPEECIEWHITCITVGNVTWKLDLIHIRKGSRYDGYIEEVTDRIAARLDPRTREAILSIKYDLGTQSDVKGVEIYNAVLEHGIHNCPDFVQWRKKNPVSGILEWMP